MDAPTLLADLRARGVELEPRGDKLHYRAPEGTVTAELLAVLAEHKSELLALLTGHCCAVCAERLARLDPLGDGCELHGVSPEDVARWWKVAEGKDATVSFCACCGAPATSGELVCKRCTGESV